MRRVLLLSCLLLLNTWAWALKPSHEWIGTPDSLGLYYQTTAIATPDHAQLAGWIVEPAATVPDRHTTMVMAYGDAGNMSYWLHQARALSQGGYRVYLFDYRGFGHSSDFAIDQQQLYYPEFSTDLRTVLADARQRYPRSRTGIMAFSMGTMMGSEVAATSKCDFLIAEGYVASPQRLVAGIFERSQKVVTLPAEAADYALVARQARWRQRRQVLCFEGGHLAGFDTLSEATYGDKYVREVTRFLAAKRS